MRGLSVTLLGLFAAPLLSCSEAPSESRPPPLVAEPAPPGSAACASGPVPGDAQLRLLTRSAYDNTVADLLGDTSQPAASFPPENRALGFNNNAEAHQVSPLLVGEFMGAAERVAASVVGSGAALCSSTSELECGRALVRGWGEKLFRRPLAAAEAAIFDRLFEVVLAGASHEKAATAVLEAMLQAPQFLYRVESVRPAAAEAGPVPLGPYELASRLSYFLLDSAPDAELMNAAAGNALGSPEQLLTQARRLLELPRAQAMVRDFHYQWLGLQELERIVREDAGTRTPAYARSFQESIVAFTDSAFWQGGGVEALFSSDTVFLNAELAPLYGVQVSAPGFVAVSQPGQRAGLLTQPALMALLAHPNQAAPVQRGVFVREHLLCDEVPPPPPNVNVVPPEPDPTATTRERFRQHTEQAACSACHMLIDPIGFGLENYDQLGRYRETENGFLVDASGAVNGLREAGLNGPFAGPFELSERLARSDSARDCLATKWFRYAMGRAETEADRCSLEPISARFRATGALRGLLEDIVVSDAFRYRRPYVVAGGKP